jgi:hypothetical protein
MKEKDFEMTKYILIACSAFVLSACASLAEGVDLDRVDDVGEQVKAFAVYYCEVPDSVKRVVDSMIDNDPEWISIHCDVLITEGVAEDTEGVEP